MLSASRKQGGGGRMKKQLLNSVIAKYRDLTVSPDQLLAERSEILRAFWPTWQQEDIAIWAPRYKIV